MSFWNWFKRMVMGERPVEKASFPTSPVNDLDEPSAETLEHMLGDLCAKRYRAKKLKKKVSHIDAKIRSIRTQLLRLEMGHNNQQQGIQK